ncbi:MAG: diacylglycerol kinase family protein [Crocinitomicaceae bacterium]|nr:diacylglycerol kinase family protein [Crocinitomicaceae bacterium]
MAEFKNEKKGIGLGFALNGIRTFFKECRNAKIHLFMAFIAVVTGIALRIHPSDWGWILLSISLVFITEMLNTSIEKLADEVTLEKNPEIGKLKDISAGAVLISALFAVAVGLIVFIPAVLRLF